MRFGKIRKPTGAHTGATAPDRAWVPLAGSVMRYPPPNFVRLVFLGDVSAANGEPPLLDDAIANVLGSADLVFLNCETPVVRRPYFPARSWLGWRRHMNAGQMLGLISALGVEPHRLVMSVANDRVMDQGPEGFQETLDTLSTLGVHVIGVARGNFIQTLHVGPVSIGMVAFTEWRRGPRRRFRKRVMMIDDLPENRWLSDAGERPDLLCAFPHWGRVNIAKPGAVTTGLAARLAEKGVRIVAGHHQRRVQPVERIGKTYVAYGLGALQDSGRSHRISEQIGAMFVVDVSTTSWERGHISAYELLPFARVSDGAGMCIMPIEGLPDQMRAEAKAQIAHLQPKTTEP